MAQRKKVVDYYEILESDRTASVEEIKKNYQRLVLASHPDKQKIDCETFHLIHKAWIVLKDPESRKYYDAELNAQEHNTLLLYAAIKVSDMDFHSAHDVYTYRCRCGGNYMLEACDADKTSVLGCEECSFSIQVN